MERAEYNRHSRARVAETAKKRVETCNTGRAGAHRPSEALHPTRVIGRAAAIARERVPSHRHANASCHAGSQPLATQPLASH